MIWSGSASSSLTADLPIRTSCTATALLQAADLLQSGSDRRPTLTWLALSRPGGGNIKDVFPKAAPLPEIDHHGGLVTMLVEQELDPANHE